ncbi:hypothetical protein DL767_010453 [Monosporascus sp. MG133]|nr:hypothetical protein DL767_010453 [Monosporascus sp. MG133]
MAQSPGRIKKHQGTSSVSIGHTGPWAIIPEPPPPLRPTPPAPRERPRTEQDPSFQSNGADSSDSDSEEEYDPNGRSTGEDWEIIGLRRKRAADA